jgi:hypothetical protein
MPLAVIATVTGDGDGVSTGGGTGAGDGAAAGADTGEGDGPPEDPQAPVSVAYSVTARESPFRAR